MSVQTLDIIYLFRHSRANDEEIRYSLRSVARHLPYIRKVWIFGDRPEFLSADTSLIEHVPHEYMAPLLGYKVPVRSDFLMLMLASLIPGVAFDFLRFSDDYIILQPLTRQQICTLRAVQDLSQSTTRGSGKWKEMLWRTYDVLKQYGYTGHNFEAHVPQPLTKQMVFEAFMAFREFLSEDRNSGLVSATTIYNYALKHHGLEFLLLSDEQSRAGIYGSCPSSSSEVAATCRDKLFLNFDDAGFGAPLLEFLAGLFPEACKYEGPH